HVHRRAGRRRRDLRDARGLARGRVAARHADTHRRPARPREGDHSGDRGCIRAHDLHVAGRLARLRAGVAGRRRLMRIALACPYAWGDPGGVQVHVRALAERLRERDHEVVVLAPTREPPMQPWVVPVGSPIDIRYNDSNAPIDPRPWSRRMVRHALATFGPDVVHAHQPMAASTGLWVTLDAGTPAGARVAS